MNRESTVYSCALPFVILPIFIIEVFNMTTHDRVRQQLHTLETRCCASIATGGRMPQAHLFTSTQPFLWDTMEPLNGCNGWLIPRMHTSTYRAPLPEAFAVAPYYAVGAGGGSSAAGAIPRFCRIRCAYSPAINFDGDPSSRPVAGCRIKPAGWLVHRSWLIATKKSWSCKRCDQIGQHILLPPTVSTDPRRACVLLMGRPAKRDAVWRSSSSSTTSGKRHHAICARLADG